MSQLLATHQQFQGKYPGYPTQQGEGVKEISIRMATVVDRLLGASIVHV
jgi:hypothetical protein